MALSAARGVTQVMARCEDAKATGYLDLSNCSLMYVTDAIYMVLKEHLTSIRTCSLKNNRLKKFPSKMVQKFPNMTVINLEGNELDSLPAEISSWSSTLRGINLSRNRLDHFPEELFSMKALSLLDLSHNSITGPGDLLTRLARTMPQLKQLHLNGNPIAVELKGLEGRGGFALKLE